MSSYYLKVTGDTKEQAQAKAVEQIKKMDFMRQPTLHSINLLDAKQPEGQWVAVIRYYGLD